MRILPVILLAALAGCESDPYKGMNLSVKPEAERYSVRPELFISTADLMSFQEGIESSFPIVVTVPEGEPLVYWEGLPPGAVYNAQERKLVWTPAFDAANDANDLSIKLRNYPVVMHLQSTVDNVSSRSKSIMLTVKDSARPMTAVGLQAKYQVIEGYKTETIAKFSISALDFDPATVRVALKNSTPGLALMRDGSDWIIKAAYGLDAVKAGRDCTYYDCMLKRSEAVVLIAPDGRQQEIPFELEVRDFRMGVVLPLPRNIEASSDLRLGFTAIDSNAEVEPLVSVDRAPDVGALTLTKIPRGDGPVNGFYEADYELVWSQIPPEAQGQSYPLRIKTCNSRALTTVGVTNCSVQDFTLTVKAREVVSPAFARGDWGVGAVKYVRLDKEITTTVRVSAGGNNRIMSARATSSDSGDVVSYADFNGILRLTGKKPGVKALTLQASNSVGGWTSEVFLYEVLPANWADHVVVGTASANAEFSTVEGLLGTANREYRAGQGLDVRSLAFRQSVFAGTQSLQLPDGALDLAFYSANVKNTIISTPLLANLPAGIVSELRSRGVYLGGRAASLPDFALKDFQVVPARTLGLPSGETMLAGATTGESVNPAVLSMSISSDCERLVSLFKPGTTPQELLVGVSCARKNGGKLIVLGFEWSDLRFAAEDAHFNAQWFNRMRE